jgi:hypothetical protein
MNSPTPDLYDQIQALAAAQCEGRLDEAGRERLESLVKADPQAARLYVQYLEESASLRLWASGVSAASASAEGADAGDWRSPLAETESMVLPAIVPPPAPRVTEPDAPQLKAPSARRLPGRSFKIRRLLVATAALLVLTLGLSLLWRPAPPKLATLASEVDPHWASTSAPHVGSTLGAGRLSLRSGTVHLIFAGGAEVAVCGPARFDLVSGSSMRLVEGKLTAHVVKKAAGFCVETPTASIVDLGTQFGVEVTQSGQTETHVLLGTVRMAARGSARPPLTMTAGDASLVSPSGVISSIPVRPAEFVERVPVTDLADVVAGGDGSTHQHDAGIDVARAVVVTGHPKAELAEGDGKFRPVAGRPLIAGTFVPLGGGVAVVLDPFGHTYNAFTNSSHSSWHDLWAGGSIPVGNDPKGQWRPPRPTVLGSVDYGAPPHWLLFMHPNKGITFDLAGLRKARGGFPMTRFRATCQNTAGQNDLKIYTQKSDVWVFVDGQLRFSRTVLRKDGPFDVDVDLANTDQYLTLVTTDGGDGYSGDWLTWGNPRLE